MVTPAIVNIWFAATAMENIIVMITGWDKFLNGPDLLHQHAALSLTFELERLKSNWQYRYNVVLLLKLLAKNDSNEPF